MNCIRENINSFDSFYKLDFRFLSHYLAEFQPELQLKVTENLELYLKGWHIATFSIASTNERMRSYRIEFYPEFITLSPENDEAINSWDAVGIDFKIDEKDRFSVIVRPELLHYWCNKIVWEAAAVICYKSHH